MPKKKTNSEFIKELKKINIPVDVLSEYTGSHEKIKCRCQKCGNEWFSPAYSILNGHGCQKCAVTTRGNKRRTTNEKFSEKMALKTNNIKSLSEYKGLKNKMLFKCLTCGLEWESIPDHILQGKGCPKCGGVYKRTHDEFIQDMKLINPNIEVLSTFQTVHLKVKCKCVVCSHIWEVIPNSLLKGFGCPKCSESKGEGKITSYLKSRNIYFDSQKSFDNLVGIGGRHLSYDFFLPEYNLLIEYQGIQHNEPIDFGCGKERAKERFKIQQEHDKRKREFAKNKNIELLEIGYKDFDDIESILKEKLNQNN